MGSLAAGVRALVLATVVAMSTAGCTLYSWGTNSFGEIGDGTNFDRDQPTPATRNPAWLAMDTGASYSCAIDTARALYCWGSGSNGRSGDPSGTAHGTPTRIGSFSDWSQLSAGEAHGCAIRVGGKLYCWGFNYDGRLGTGSLTDELPPTQVGTATDWVAVSAGGEHTCGIRNGGASLVGATTRTVSLATTPSRNAPRQCRSRHTRIGSR